MQKHDSVKFEIGQADCQIETVYKSIRECTNTCSELKIKTLK